MGPSLLTLRAFAFGVSKPISTSETICLQEMILELNGDADDKKDAVIVALLASAENVVKESHAGALRDAGLLATGKKSSTTRSPLTAQCWSGPKALGLAHQVELLHKTLEEEKHANEVLGSISKRAKVVATA